MHCEPVSEEGRHTLSVWKSFCYTKVVKSAAVYRHDSYYAFTYELHTSRSSPRAYRTVKLRRKKKNYKHPEHYVFVSSVGRNKGFFAPGIGGDAIWIRAVYQSGAKEEKGETEDGLSGEPPSGVVTLTGLEKLPPMYTNCHPPAKMT
ncbi:hypothetical protein QTP88_023517 [Uroleucon formosanum]